MNTPIETAMQKRELSIHALTAQAGIGRNATRRALRGEEINYLTAQRIATALDVHALDIFEDADNGSKQIRRLTPFEIPLPPTGRGANPSGWEHKYGSHPDAQKARTEARRLRYGD